MLSTPHAKMALKVIIPLFIAILSIFVLSRKIPETKFVESSIESLEKSKTTVMEFSGATLATSLAISALPDDFASPYANILANMNMYFVVVLIAIIIERLILVEGIKISFFYLIPIACGLYIVSILSGRQFIKNLSEKFAYKLAVFGCALVLVIPCSTHFTNFAAADYLKYVDETISETSTGADKINDALVTNTGSDTIFEKLTNAFKTAIQGISDLLTYFNNVIKKCINSIAVLIVTTIVMPVFTLLFFKWLIKELFGISIPVNHLRRRSRKLGLKGTDDEPVIGETNR